MIQQQFRAYLRLAQLPNELKAKHGIKLDAKTPRFDLLQMSGYYPPIKDLENKKGMAVFYLNDARGVINSPEQRRADRFLMGKSSLNFSSVYLLDCNQSGAGYLYGYGNPNRQKTYSKDKLPNPFLEYKNDGYLFVISKDWSTIEVLVIAEGFNTVVSNAKALADGVYNEALQSFRATAELFCVY